MKKKGFLIIILFALFSCSKEIEIEIPSKKASLVVHSTIVPFTLSAPKELGIELQSSIHISGGNVPQMDDATVLYFENDKLKEKLEYSYETKNYRINNNISDYPLVGNKYSIQISKVGYDTIYASTTIPSKVAIIDTAIMQIAYFDEDGGVYSEISITFKDPYSEINYYEIALSDIGVNNDSYENFYRLTSNDAIITSESYYPSLARFDVKKPKYLLFNDKEINGKEHKLTIFYVPPQMEGNERWIIPHYRSIHLRNVTEEYYKYKTTKILQITSNKEDILYGMGEPLNLVSNIKNGFGFFAGYNTDIVSIKLDSLIVK